MLRKVLVGTGLLIGGYLVLEHYIGASSLINTGSAGATSVISPVRPRPNESAGGRFSAGEPDEAGPAPTAAAAAAAAGGDRTTATPTTAPSAGLTIG